MSSNSKLLFKDDEYTFGELWKAFCTNKSVYKSGEVVDLIDGEVIDISELTKYRAKYLDESINDLRDLGMKEWSLARKLKSEKDKIRLQELEVLYVNGTINSKELKQLIELKYDKNSLRQSYSFSSYMFVNTEIKLPELSNDDLGKFYKLCHFHLTHDSNKLKKTKNIKSRSVSVEIIGETLGIKSSSTYLFLSKLEKLNILKYIIMDKNKFMVINPIYMLNGKLTPINYMMFKEDIDKCLPNIPKELTDLWEMEFYEIGLIMEG